MTAWTTDYRNIHHSTLFRLADYPILEQLARRLTGTQATCLDARACKWIYEKGLSEIGLADIQPDERELIEGLGLADMVER